MAQKGVPHHPAGENCTEIICDGISNVNVSVCGGHGQCVEPDTCKCDAGWDMVHVIL